LDGLRVGIDGHFHGDGCAGSCGKIHNAFAPFANRNRVFEVGRK